jgi:hypothetical protein
MKVNSTKKVHWTTKHVQDCLEQVLCKELPTEMTHLWWLSSGMHELLILRGVDDKLKLADLASLLKKLAKHDAVRSRKLHKQRFFRMQDDRINTAPGCSQPSVKKVATACKLLHGNESLLTLQTLNDALCDRERHTTLKSDRNNESQEKQQRPPLMAVSPQPMLNVQPDDNKENRPPAMTNQQLPSPAMLVSPLDTFVCVACGQKLTHKTCTWKRSLIVAPGRKCSKQQPELSLHVPLAAKLAGVSPVKLSEFFSHIGVQMPTVRNITCQNDKPNALILDAGKKHILRNRAKTVLAVKESPDFDKDRDILVHFDSTTGERHETVVTKGTIDGAGATREYNHLMTGTQSASSITASITRLPIGIRVDRTGCMRCTRAMHQAAREGKDPLMHLRQHDGPCTSNSRCGPAQAEERAMAICGEDLLRDENGNYRGNKQAIFLGTTVSDGDSKGAHRLLQKQAEIIGPAALGRAERSPCLGHSSKCLSNAMYNIKKVDASFGGIGGLENDRIKAILCDINLHTRLLGSKINVLPKPSSAEADKHISNALKGIKAVVPHHCGIHSGCVGADHCGYLALKLNNPLWRDKTVLSASEEQELQLECYAQARFRYEMKLNAKGVESIQKVILARITMKTLPQLANQDSTNQNESLWGQVTKCSEGKRINMNYSQAWEIAVYTAILRVSNGEGYASELYEQIGLKINQQQSQHQERVERKRKKDYRNHHSPSYIASRCQLKRIKKLKVEDSKKMC